MSWPFGLGRSVGFTSNATAGWAAEWMVWKDAGRFWSRLVRWASRRETDDLQVAVDERGDAVTVIADAVTTEGTTLDGLDVQAGVSGPLSAQIPLVQTAPGRDEARLPQTAPGVYALAATARGTDRPVRG